MKTPREILLGRRRAVEPKLDQMRKEIVSGTVAAGFSLRGEGAPMKGTATERATLSGFLNGLRENLWRELIFPLRWHVAAMSALWLVAVLLSIDHSPAASPTPVSQVAQSPQRFLMALQENRRQLLELIESPVSQPRSAQPPRRRSELQPSTAKA